MSARNWIRERRNILVVTVPIVVILVPIFYSVFGGVAGDDGDSPPFLVMPDPKYEQCVKETTYMRFHHWELLRQVREEYVRHGIRGDISLHGCRECHADREQFCNQCHNAVNLKPDCFGCHYYPETPASVTTDPHADVKTQSSDQIVAATDRVVGG
jgi:hypothetical protein